MTDFIPHPLLSACLSLNVKAEIRVTVTGCRTWIRTHTVISIWPPVPQVVKFIRSRKRFLKTLKFLSSFHEFKERFTHTVSLSFINLYIHPRWVQLTNPRTGGLSLFDEYHLLEGNNIQLTGVSHDMKFFLHIIYIFFLFLFYKRCWWFTVGDYSVLSL